MKYDDASWHYGGEFPSDSPEEYGGTHIGLFLKWCFLRGWAGEMHLKYSPEAVEAVKAGQMTGTEFLLTVCGEKFTDEDLNADGNRFASKYYGDDGLYLLDYTKYFGEQMYVASEQEHNFQKFSGMMDNWYEQSFSESQ